VHIVHVFIFQSIWYTRNKNGHYIIDALSSEDRSDKPYLFLFSHFEGF